MIFLLVIMLFLIHTELNKRDSITVLPSLLFIIMYPSYGLSFLITYILVLTIIAFFKNLINPQMNGYKSLFLVYALLILSIFLESNTTLNLIIGVPSLFFLVLFFFLYKKENISILIIPSLIISFFLFKCEQNPYLIGLILGIFSTNAIFKKDYYLSNMGAHLLLFFLLDLIIPHSIYLDSNITGIILNKTSLYILVLSIIIYFVRKRL